MYKRALAATLLSLLVLGIVDRARAGNIDAETLGCMLGLVLATGRIDYPTMKEFIDGDDGLDDEGYRVLPVTDFEPNFGQTDRRYSWLSRGSGFYLFLRAEGAVMDLRTGQGRPNGLIEVTFEGANGGAAAEPGEYRSLQHYLLGSDSSRWVTDIPVFSAVTFSRVYPGVDLTYYQRDGLLEHDWIVRPGASARQIRMRFGSGTAVRVDDAGNLSLRTGNAEVIWHAPRSYERRNRRPVPSRWQIEPSGAVSIDAVRMDPSDTLVIDPPMEYLTYAGRSGPEVSGRAASDSQGNQYFTASTTNGEWPTTPGAALVNRNGFTPTNAVVAKLSADGKQLLYSTVFGGVEAEVGVGVAVDPSGNILLTGVTTSTDFPTTANATQRTPPPLGPSDPNSTNCYVVKLNAAGNSPIFSTYLGGTRQDMCTAIASDRQGNVYVAGMSNSNDFPVTPGAFQERYRLGTAPENHDLVMVKFNPTGTERLYSTYIGGGGFDLAFGMAVDGDGAAYLTGATSSTNFPVTAGAIRPTFSGRSINLAPLEAGDAFVLKIARDGGSLAYSTYLGGSGDDVGMAVQVDGQGNAYVAGNTMSTNFPVTAGAYQTQYKGAGGMNFKAGDCFISKVNPSGTQLLYSTLFGGSGDERCVAMGIDGQGSVWAAGHTHSKDFPLTPDALQTTNKTLPSSLGQILLGDGFVFHLTPDGSRVNYSTYLGGIGHELITGLSMGPDGLPMVVGVTSSKDLPVTAGTYQSQPYGGIGRQAPLDDIFVAKFGGGGGAVSVAAVVNAASYAQNRITPGMIVTLAGSGIGPAQLQTAGVTNGRFPTSLADTEVSFDGTAAPIIYVSAGQSSVVVPYNVAGKSSVQVVVSRGGIRSNPLTVPVAEAAPGLFSANSSGQGPGAILNQNNSLNTAQNPADQRSVIILYGTGEGRVSNVPGDGTLVGLPLPAPVLPVRVTVAGRECNVLYAGAAPGLVAGLFQINAELPPNVPSGNQPVVVTVGTTSSQSGLTVAVR